MVFEHEREYSSQWGAVTSIAAKIGCTAETLRKWVRQAERDQGRRAGLTTDERQRLKGSKQKRVTVYGRVQALLMRPALVGACYSP